MAKRMKRQKKRCKPLPDNLSFQHPVYILVGSFLLTLGWFFVHLVNFDKLVVSKVERGLNGDVMNFTLNRVFNHDQNAFTQGFLVDNGKFVESTGLFGNSSLRIVDIESGKVEKILDLPSYFFGEGVVSYGDSYIMLTWKSQTAIIVDKKTFEIKKLISYSTTTGEGWGITCDMTNLIVSDGSSYLLFWDPITLKQIRKIQVKTPDGTKIERLNELEYINGSIYANVWMTTKILRIDPQNGNVTQQWDGITLLDKTGKANSIDAVMNGIAYDSNTKAIYFTGKLWNSVFEMYSLTEI